MLRLRLAGIAGAAAGEDVHGVRVAVAVIAAAETVLPFIFVDLAGEHVLVRREAFIGLDDHLIAPLGRIACELDRARDRTAGALGAAGDEDGARAVGGNLLGRGPHGLRLCSLAFGDLWEDRRSEWIWTTAGPYTEGIQNTQEKLGRTRKLH